MKVQFIDSHKKVLDTFLLENSLVKPGKMFGHPAYYVGKKVFASLYMQGVCIKIPAPRVQELLKKEDFIPFEPMGRRMKEWIFIVHENSNDYLEDKLIFEESINYVGSFIQSGKKK